MLSKVLTDIKKNVIIKSKDILFNYERKMPK